MKNTILSKYLHTEFAYYVLFFIVSLMLSILVEISKTKRYEKEIKDYMKYCISDKLDNISIPQTNIKANAEYLKQIKAALDVSWANDVNVRIYNRPKSSTGIGLIFFMILQILYLLIMLPRVIQNSFTIRKANKEFFEIITDFQNRLDVSEKRKHALEDKLLLIETSKKDGD